MALNVNRAVSDPFYRYKMPKLSAKVEGRGNGIKTVIANMSEIAKALERPPMYPTKYFGCELGTQTNFDAKNERYIVNGEHNADKLQDILDGFIKKFVLCPACENPETQLIVRRNAINSKCKACGHVFAIDNKHKLATYIVKNPPKIDLDFSKVEKNVKKTSTEEVVNEVLNGSGNDKGSSNDDDDDDWEPEPLESTPELTVAMGKLIIDKDLEKSEEQRLDMLHSFFIKARDDGRISSEDQKVQKSLLDEAERLELKQKASLLLADVLFNENILAEKQIQTYRKLLLRFVINDKKAQRYFLGGIEQLIAKHESVLLAKSAHVIKTIYDADICEEEAILAWGDKPSSKYISKTTAKKIIDNSKVFLTWLREAEEESEEESDDEIAFDEEKKESEFLRKQREEAERKAKMAKTNGNSNGTDNKNGAVEEDEDDLDIDDI